MRFCVLAAGRGTRCTAIPGLHKALWPIGGRAVVSRLLDAVPRDVEVVVALGHLGDQVQAFLAACHDDRRLTFVRVQNYDGPGSGPGESLFSCRDALEGDAFVFAPCDALVTSIPYVTHPAAPREWVGIGGHGTWFDDAEAAHYVRRRRDGTFYYPTPGQSVEGPAFAGFASVVDSERFFRALASAPLVRGERQTWAGLAAGAPSMEVQGWRDVGRDAAYLYQRAQHEDRTPRKPGQELFVEGGRVVKFFEKPGTATTLALRARSIPMAPAATVLHETLLARDFIPGRLLADVPHRATVAAFLRAIADDYIAPAREPTDAERASVEAMHVTKVRDRAALMVEREAALDAITAINGTEVAPIQRLLAETSYWPIRAAARMSPAFHGDLQPENVVVLDDGSFAVIDWRTGFDGLDSGGEVLYDLGKLVHGLLLGGAERGGYDVTIEGAAADVAFRPRSHLLGNVQEVRRMVRSTRLLEVAWEGVVLAALLQLVNISPLYQQHHEGAYGRFLFLYGKLLLTRWRDGARDLLELL